MTCLGGVIEFHSTWTDVVSNGTPVFTVGDHSFAVSLEQSTC